jgi:hypothetical protein
MGVGLVAAALTDLLLRYRVRVEHGRVYPNGGPSGPAGDAVSTELLRGIDVAHAPLLAEVLRGDRTGRRAPHGRVYGRTRATLVKDGILRRQGLTLHGVRYRLADPDLIASMRKRVNDRLLHPHESADLALDVLCAVAWASNLHTYLTVPCTGEEADRALRSITEQIPIRAGQGSPLAIVPHLVPVVRRAIADLTITAP